ncbi:MAG: sensor histidine kinase [Gammaproteobacteria bacterium]|nr:sensor histidine kinase [Gammaproteobacteria bacterium]
MKNSLAYRLQLGLAVSLVLLMGIIGGISSHAINALTEEFVVSRLEHDTESLLGALVLDESQLRLRWRRLNQIYQQPFSGHYYIVRFDDGQVFNARSLWDFELEVPVLKPGEQQQFRIVGPDGQHLLVIARGYRKQGQIFTLLIAEDMTPIQKHLDRFLGNMALLAIAGILLLLIVQSLVIRNAFKRLVPLQNDIRRLESGEIEKLSQDVPTEILPLVSEFNRLLQQLSQRLERSRNALGNLSHALKGPLNLLTQYFDVDQKNQENIQQLQARQQTDRIRQLMERELKRARLAGSGLSNVRFDPKKELPDLIALLRQVYRQRGLDLSLDIGEAIPVFGDREDMLELMGNLLDNACKWAESKVSCEVSFNGEVLILIEDDGKGISEYDLKQLTGRGTRLDETTEGHGLGLAIAKDIVKLHGGTMTFQASENLGGLKVQVLFSI